MNLNQHSIAKNAILNIVYKISSILFPLLTYPYVSRILLSDGLGKVAFFTNVTNYALLIGSLGISTYGIRAVAKCRDSKEDLVRVSKELLFINTIVTVLVLFALFCSFFFVDKFRTNSFLFLICIGQVAISPISMEWLYGGLEQYSYITIRAVIFKIISLLLIFLFIHTRDDYKIYALITAFGYVGNYICNFIHSRKYINWKYKNKLNLKVHLKPTLWLFASLLSVNIYTNVDSIMLGFICGDSALGLYDIAVKAKTVLLSLINAISAVLLPRLSYYVSQKNDTLYGDMLRKSIRVIFIIAIPLTIFFEIAAADCILVLGGEHFRAAIPCMMILMPILLISGFSNITGNQILIPHNMDSCFTKAVTAGAVVDIVLNAILLPRFSLYGAAVATVIAEFVQMLIQVMYSRRYLKNMIDLSAVSKIILATIASGGIIMTLRYFVEFHPIINLMVNFGVFIILYYFALYLMNIKEAREVKAAIRSLINRS